MGRHRLGRAGGAGRGLLCGRKLAGQERLGNHPRQVGEPQEKLDWAAYIPPAVPDDQNFFKAPRMQDWFAGNGANEFTTRLSLDTFADLAWHRDQRQRLRRGAE